MGAFFCQSESTFTFWNIYRKVVACDLQVQIKMTIENSLLSKSPYKTILECRQISLSLSSIIHNMPYGSVFSRAMLCITQTNYFSYIHSLPFCTVNSIQAIQQEILYSILIKHRVTVNTVLTLAQCFLTWLTSDVVDLMLERVEIFNLFTL